MERRLYIFILSTTHSAIRKKTIEIGRNNEFESCYRYIIESTCDTRITIIIITSRYTIRCEIIFLEYRVAQGWKVFRPSYLSNVLTRDWKLATDLRNEDERSKGIVKKSIAELVRRWRIDRRSVIFAPVHSNFAESFSFPPWGKIYRALTGLHKLRSTDETSRKFITLSLSLSSILSFFFLLPLVFIDKLDFNRASSHLAERKSPTKGRDAFFRLMNFPVKHGERRRPPPRPATWLCIQD